MCIHHLQDLRPNCWTDVRLKNMRNESAISRQGWYCKGCRDPEIDNKQV